MEENNRFVVKKLPDLPQMDGFYNIKIDSNDFILDKEHLLKLKSEIENILKA